MSIAVAMEPLVGCSGLKTWLGHELTLSSSNAAQLEVRILRGQQHDPQIRKPTRSRTACTPNCWEITELVQILGHERLLF